MGKTIKDENLVLNIIVNGDKGKKEIAQLDKTIKDLEMSNEKLLSKMKKMEKAGQTETDAYKKLTAQIKKNNDALQLAKDRRATLIKGMDLEKMSLRDLKREYNKLKQLRDIATPGTASWKNYDDQLKKVGKQMRKVRSTGSDIGGSLCRAADKINKYWNLAATAVATFIGAILSLKSISKKWIEFSDVLADARKTTGLLDDEIRSLNEDLKGIDTRTSQSELLGLVRIGGKLGVQGKKDLEGFARAADQINVALKEDLGGDTEEAIRRVGKLVDIFHLKDELGLEQALLKTGSAINALGASSTANEGYIVEFANRTAGIAPLANISMQNIMGLGATLDSLGQTSEVSSTVFAQVVPNMFKDTATYAQVAGMSTKAFSELLKSDANEAFIKMLEGLNGNNEGMATLTNKLDTLGIEGKRSIGVLGVLANNTKTLREQQALANSEFEKGTSLTEEFNVKNTNAAAKLEKAKKKLDNILLSLGEKLQPIMTHATSSFSVFVKVMMATVDFLSKYGKELLYVCGVIGTYTIIVNRAIIADKLKYFWQNKLIESLNKLWKVLLKNPWTAIATGIAAAAIYLYNYNKRQKEVLETTKNYSEEIVKQKRGLNSLVSVITKVGEKTELRKKLIKKLNKLYPDFLKNLDLEKISNEDILRRLKEVNEQYDKKIRLSALQAKIKAYDNKSTEAEERRIEIEDRLQYLESERYRLGKKADEERIELEKEYATLTNKINGYQSRRNKLLEKANKLSSEIDNVGSLQYYKDELDGVKKYIAGAEKAVSKAKKENNETSIKYYNDLLSKAKADEKYLERKVKLLKEIKEQEEKDKDKDKDKNENNGDVNNPVNIEFQTKINELKEQYANLEITKEEYEGKLDVLELTHLQHRLDNEKLTAEKRVQLEGAIADKKIKIAESVQKAIKILDDEFGEELDQEYKQILDDIKNLSSTGSYILSGANKTKSNDDNKKKSVRSSLGLAETEEEESYNNKFSIAPPQEQMDMEIEKLQTYYNFGYLSYEEFERKKTEITKKYSKQRGQIAQMALNAANQLFGAGADYFSRMKEKELAAAGDNEKKKEKIRRKYAKKEQAMAIAQAITSGALAIMRIWAGSVSKNPLIDTIIKTGLTVAQAATNAIQIATIKSQQFAKGRYLVQGADDGQVYQSGYVGKPKTGIYKNASLGLFSEKEPEMVVDGPTTRKLVFDYPVIYNAIRTISAGGVPQFAEGRYPSRSVDYESSTNIPDNSIIEKEIQSLYPLLERLTGLLERGIKADVSWYGNNGIQEKMNESKLLENNIRGNG